MRVDVLVAPLTSYLFTSYCLLQVRVDVLVSELNFGAGSRWVKAGATLPEAPTVDA